MSQKDKWYQFEIIIVLVMCYLQIIKINIA